MLAYVCPDCHALWQYRDTPEGRQAIADVKVHHFHEGR